MNIYLAQVNLDLGNKISTNLAIDQLINYVNVGFDTKAIHWF